MSNKITAGTYFTQVYHDAMSVAASPQAAGAENELLQAVKGPSDAAVEKAYQSVKASNPGAPAVTHAQELALAAEAEDQASAGNQGAAKNTLDDLFEVWANDRGIPHTGADFAPAWAEFQTSLADAYGGTIPADLEPALAAAQQQAAVTCAATPTDTSDNNANSPAAVDQEESRVLHQYILRDHLRAQQRWTETLQTIALKQR